MKRFEGLRIAWGLPPKCCYWLRCLGIEGIQAGNTWHMEEHLVKALPQIDLGPNLLRHLSFMCPRQEAYLCEPQCQMEAKAPVSRARWGGRRCPTILLREERHIGNCQKRGAAGKSRMWNQLCKSWTICQSSICPETEWKPAHFSSR